jgi:hypothetical protein
MKALRWVAITSVYALSAYYEITWIYYPVSVLLFVLALLGTFALFTVNSAEFAQHAIDRNLGWALYPNCFINTGVLAYLGWHVAALIYGTMILMGLAKRLTGLYKLRLQNT